MYKQIKQVKEFSEAFNQKTRTGPVESINQFEANHRIVLLEEEIKELADALRNDDLIESVDAIIDCMYILIGTAHNLGVANKLELCFDEVHKSNMTKLENGKPIFDQNGKVKKGRNYERPELFDIIYKQKTLA